MKILKKIKHSFRRKLNKLKNIFKKEKEETINNPSLEIKGNVPYKYYYAYRNEDNTLTRIHTCEALTMNKVTSVMEMIELDLEIENTTLKEFSNIFLLIGPRVVNLEDVIFGKSAIHIKNKIVAKIIPKEKLTKNSIINVEDEKCILFFTEKDTQFYKKCENNKFLKTEVISKTDYNNLMNGLKIFND